MMGSLARFDGVRVVCLTFALSLLTLAAFPALSSAAAPGSLSQLGSPFACLKSNTGEGCASGRFLTEVNDVAVSPDGRFVYAVSSTTEGAANSGSIEVFSRDPATGALTQLGGAAGCVSGGGIDGQGGHNCGSGSGLRGAKSLTLSPDGSNIYVASSGQLTATSGQVNATAIFSRNAGNGALSQAAGTAGCISDGTEPGCSTIAGAMKDVRKLVVSPDGNNVYAAVPEDPGAGDDGLILELSRNPTTGALTQIGCFSVSAAGCTTPARAMTEPNDLKITADGTQIYVAASEGVRNQCTVQGSPDSCGAVVLLNRNTTSGVLSQPAGPLGCINDSGKDETATAGTCATLTTGKSLEDANAIAFSPDAGAMNVYVASQGLNGNNALEYGALTVFSRSASTGALSQPAGALGCISEDGSDGVDGPTTTCSVAHGMFEPSGVSVAPDGQTVYLASSDGAGYLSSFARNTSTGNLTQLANTDGCVSSDGTDLTNSIDCAVGLGVRGANAIAVSPTGPCQNVYLAAQDSSAIASFVRNPSCPVATAPLAATGAATGVTVSRAKVFGTVNPHGSTTTYRFDYGLTKAYGAQTPAINVGAGTGSLPESAALLKLAPGKVYHYRIEASNAGGTSLGTDVTFTTKRAAPKGVTVSVKPSRATVFPYRYTVSGKLALPAGVSAKDGCKGRVSVQLKRGRSTVFSRRVGVGPKCGYSAHVTLGNRKRLASSGRLSVRTRFLGNGSLGARSGATRFVRYG